MSTTNLSARISQNRYILSRLGIQPWCLAGAAPVVSCSTLMRQQDAIGFGQAMEEVPPVVVDAPKAPDEPSVLHNTAATTAACAKDDAKQPTPDSAVHKMAASKAVDGIDQVATSANITLASKDLAIRYQLSAIRYGQWLLLMDDDRVPMAEQGVWLSLAKALADKAEAEGRTYQLSHLSYPLMTGDASANQPLLAQMSLMGFIFGLTGGDEAVQVACLSDLHEALSLDAAADLPTLAVMVRSNDAKKQFWQRLHADT